MTVKYVVLAEEIESEVSKLKKVKEKILKGVSKISKQKEEKDIYIDSVAINLHSFYTGLENIFKSIALKVDGEMPTRERWHTDLLIQMTSPLQDIRQAVISEPIKEGLKELLAFRHLIRNIYSFQLDEELVLKMAKKLSLLNKKLFNELKRFVEFLRTTGNKS